MLMTLSEGKKKRRILPVKAVLWHWELQWTENIKFKLTNIFKLFRGHDLLYIYSDFLYWFRGKFWSHTIGANVMLAAWLLCTIISYLVGCCICSHYAALSICSGFPQSLLFLRTKSSISWYECLPEAATWHGVMLQPLARYLEVKST